MTREKHIFCDVSKIRILLVTSSRMLVTHALQRLHQSRSQRLHSFWSAPRMQDLWDNQCQNANESKSDWLLKFTGSLRVRSFKTGNENFAGRFRSRQRRTVEKKSENGLYKLPKNR